jgi:acyl carrier protein
MTDFELQLRDKIIARLGLDGLDPSSLDSSTALFGAGLDLDSIDALEIEAMVAEEWGITIHPSERTGATFASFGALASFILANMHRDIPPT